jgi:hypothetical protein
MINQEELKKHCKAALEKMTKEYRATMRTSDYQTIAVFIKTLEKEVEASQSREPISNENVYTSCGYKDRDDYLTSMSVDFNIDEDIVKTLADTLGSNEDFDGLVSTLEDMKNNIY